MPRRLGLGDRGSLAKGGGQGEGLGIQQEQFGFVGKQIEAGPPILEQGTSQGMNPPGPALSNDLTHCGFVVEGIHRTRIDSEAGVVGDLSVRVDTGAEIIDVRSIARKILHHPVAKITREIVASGLLTEGGKAGASASATFPTSSLLALCRRRA